MPSLTTKVDRVADTWREEGLRSPAQPASNTGVCQIEDCSTIAFVELKTSEGKRKVCLQHFVSIKAALGIN